MRICFYTAIMFLENWMIAFREGKMDNRHRQDSESKELQIPSSVRSCMEVLEGAGYEAFLVGGAVRDLLLGMTPYDFDVATNAVPSEVQEIFGRSYTIPTGIKHGTVTVLSQNKTIEVTTYRVDGEYTDSRRPDQVIFSQSLAEDVKRRDLTINALAMTKGGKIIDYIGGMADIGKKLIRTVGQPGARMEEDPLRILRALRFQATLGFAVEENTDIALHEKCHLLSKISSERIWREFIGLLCGEHVADVLLQYPDIIGIVFPDILPMIGFEQHNPHHRFDVWEHTVETVKNIPTHETLRLAAFFHDIGKPRCFSLGPDGVGHFYGHQKISAEIARQIMTSYKSDHITREEVAVLVSNHDIPIDRTEKSVKRRLCQFGEKSFSDLLALKRADALAQSEMSFSRLADYEQISQIADKVRAEDACFSLNHLAITGKDLLALGIEQGPGIGEILSELLWLVIDGAAQNDREALLTIVKEIRQANQ